MVLGVCLVTQRWNLGKERDKDERGEGRGGEEGGAQRERRGETDSPSNLRLKPPGF